MKGRHFGIFALALLPILLTVPSAFADHDPAHDSALEYSLMLSISDAQSDLTNLQAMAENNGFTVEYGDYNIATFDEAAGLVDDFQYEAAQTLLDDAELSHDYIYDQFYEQIEEQQDVRFDEYVESAKFSLTFLIENGPALGLTQPTILQLATTLEVLEYGTDSQIKAATGGNSQIGITLSVLPNDLSLPSSLFQVLLVQLLIQHLVHVIVHFLMDLVHRYLVLRQIQVIVQRSLVYYRHHLDYC